MYKHVDFFDKYGRIMQFNKNKSVPINEALIGYIDTIKSTSEKVKHDLNNIMYFVNIVAQYNEDVILSAFFNEPNIEDAISRNKKIFL